MNLRNNFRLAMSIVFLLLAVGAAFAGEFFVTIGEWADRKNNEWYGSMVPIKRGSDDEGEKDREPDSGRVICEGHPNTSRVTRSNLRS
jgi:hypothetical protein